MFTVAKQAYKSQSFMTMGTQLYSETNEQLLLNHFDTPQSLTQKPNPKWRQEKVAHQCWAARVSVKGPGKPHFFFLRLLLISSSLSLLFSPPTFHFFL